MKINKVIRICLFILLIVCLIALLNACYSVRKQNYYSQKENYVQASGTVTHIKYNEERTALFLGFSDLVPEFDDTCFKIVGDNLKIVQNRGIDDKLKLGDRIEFMSAPKYFGDGYVMPIVSITVNGEVLLTFQEGYEGWMKYLE